MNTEFSTKTTSVFKKFLIIAGLIYLLIPNLLFLLGWVQPYVALPVAMLLIAVTGWVSYRLNNSEASRPIKPFSAIDWVLILVILAGVLLLTDTIGFFANIKQHWDFTYRNAIYATLVCEDWPVYSSNGDYFIYYHAFWLPPALLTKCFGGTLSPHAALYWWSYVGLALSSCLIYTELRKKTFFLFFLLLATAPFSSAANRYAFHLHLEGTLHDTLYIPYFYLTNIWGSQLRCVFNHAIPCLIFLAIILNKNFPVRYILVPAAFLFCMSPMAAIASTPLLALIVYQEWRITKKLPINVPSICCTLLVGIVLIYFSQQNNEHSASLRLLWSESPYWVIKSYLYEHASFRILHAVVLCVSLLLPLFILLDKEQRSTIYFKAFVCITLLVSSIWIGRENNELLFKGSLILGVLQALLLVKQWASASRLRKCGLALFIAISFMNFLSAAVLTIIASYSCDHKGKEENLTNEMNWSLDHPDHMHYRNFFADNHCQWLLSGQQGDANKLLPVNSCKKSIFTGE